MAVSVRMDPLLEKELEQAARRQGVSKSQFIITAVERALGLEAAARQAGYSSTEITRRHYVERSVIVPDYSAALTPFSVSKPSPDGGDGTVAKSESVSDLA